MRLGVRFSPGAPFPFSTRHTGDPSLLLGISPADSRFAHARKTAQVRFSPGAPFSLSKGFSIRTPAIICPAFRSSEKIRLAPHLTADATIRASQNPIRDSSLIRDADEL